MSTRFAMRSLVMWVSVVLLAAMAGGCSDQLKEENLTLKERLRVCQGDLDKACAQLAEAQGENQRLQGELAAAQQRRTVGQPMATTPPPAPAPDFGPGIDVTQTGQSITVTLPEEILFDSGKADLKGPSKATLSKIAAVIKRDYAAQVVRVEGHTDNQPIKRSKWADNWELSVERGLAVVRYLTGPGGLDPQKVYPAGRSQYDPKASNASTAGKAKNRRVQIVITKD